MTLFHISYPISLGLFLIFIYVEFGYFKVAKPKSILAFPPPVFWPASLCPVSLPSDALAVFGIILTQEITWLCPLCFRIFALMSPCPGNPLLVPYINYYTTLNIFPFPLLIIFLSNRKITTWYITDIFIYFSVTSARMSMSWGQRPYLLYPILGTMSGT